MGIFRLKVVQRGTIVVEGVDSLEDAEEYIESCNPVDDLSLEDKKFLSTNYKTSNIDT